MYPQSPDNSQDTRDKCMQVWPASDQSHHYWGHFLEKDQDPVVPFVPCFIPGPPGGLVEILCQFDQQVSAWCSVTRPPFSTGLLQNVHLLILYVCTSGHFYGVPGLVGYIQSQIVTVLAQTTLGRPRLGLERTGQPIRALSPSFLVFTQGFSCFMNGEMRNLSFFINTFTK